MTTALTSKVTKAKTMAQKWVRESVAIEDNDGSVELAARLIAQTMQNDINSKTLTLWLCTYDAVKAADVDGSDNYTDRIMIAAAMAFEEWLVVTQRTEHGFQRITSLADEQIVLDAMPRLAIVALG